MRRVRPGLRAHRRRGCAFDGEEDRGPRRRHGCGEREHSHPLHRDILWHDYFKPEHLEKYPKLHDTFWKAAKLCSKNKTEQDPANGEALLTAIEEIHGMFWGSKGRDVAFYRAS